MSGAAVALYTEAESSLTVAKETATAATSGPSAQATVSDAEIYELNQVQQSLYEAVRMCLCMHSPLQH